MKKNATTFLNKNCPCANKQCPLWGKCVECRKAMKAEGVPPACEQ